MVSPRILRELQTHLDRLRPEQQDRVVDFARRLGQSATPPGTPPSKLLPLAGTLPDEDAEKMKQIIEDAFERVDPDAW